MNPGLRTAFVLVGLALLFGGTACTSHTDSAGEVINCPVAGDQNPGIFGGQKVHPDSWVGRRVVAILTKGADGVELCTGSLIDRNIVLTAAHCVNKSEDASVTKVVFTANPICEIVSKGNRNVMRDATAIRIHKSYRVSKTEDLAMIRFDGVAPEGYQTVRLADKTLPLTSATRILLAGYGVNSDYNDSASNDPHDLKFTSVAPYSGAKQSKSLKQMNDSPSMYFDQTNGTGACAGDSGGPAFTRDEGGSFRVIGVASRTDPLDGQEFEKQSDVTCHKGIVYTSVLYFRSWIETSFGELKNSDSAKAKAFDP